MFKYFLKQELSNGLKQPLIYIAFSLIALLSFGAVVSENITLGGTHGDLLKNSAYIIVTYTALFSFIGLIINAAFFNNASLRDYQFNFDQILFATPVKKSSYYFGRFIGALLLSSIPMLGVFIGVLIAGLVGPALDWISPNTIGAYPWHIIIPSYFIFILPNIFLAGALIFGLGIRFKNTLVSFLGAIGIIVMYFISLAWTSDYQNQQIAALFDVFGLGTFNYVTKYLSAFEKNMLPNLWFKTLLMNRLIWLSVATLVLFVQYKLFNFTTKTFYKKKKHTEEKSIRSFEFITLPKTIVRHNTWFTKMLVVFSTAKNNCKYILKHPVFVILAIFTALLSFSNLSGSFDFQGLKSYPLTYKALEVTVNNAQLFIIIVVVFFISELYWQDKSIKIDGIVNSTPSNSSNRLWGKIFSVWIASTILFSVSAVTIFLFQTVNGFFNYQFDLIIEAYLLKIVPFLIIYSGVTLLLNYLFNHKYLALFITIVIILGWDFLLSSLNISTNLLSFAGKPTIKYSDMSGYGPGLESTLWFNAYWILIGLMLIQTTGSLSNHSFLFKQSFSLSNLLKLLKPVAVLGLLATGTGSYIYYNTHILNESKSLKENELNQVAYEQQYKQFEHIAQPKIVGINYNIDLTPKQRKLNANTELILSNNTNQPITEIHFTVANDWLYTFNFNSAKVIENNTDLGYFILALSDTLSPNDTISGFVNCSFEPKGFKNDRGSVKVLQNGTFVHSTDFVPSIGYNVEIELSDRKKREKYNLPKRFKIPALQKNCAHKCFANYISDDADFIPITTKITTQNDQIALAPGSLVMVDSSKNDRTTYYYDLEQPALHFFSAISGTFSVQKRKWNGVDLEVYYHPTHGYNVESMLDAMELSLAYYSKVFGPYPHKQCRIVEFPRYSTYAQAFPGTMPYSENYGFVTDLENRKHNVVTKVIAHEIAHQWWAHQVSGANMQGATLLSESFSEYAALMAMKSIVKNDQDMIDFLSYDVDEYLEGRTKVNDPELPLFKCTPDQSYAHYNKGSVVLFGLQSIIGETKLNQVLSDFLVDYAYQTPYPTSIDFLDRLESAIPDSNKYLVQEWFKEVNLYDQKLLEAKLDSADGTYSISVAVECEKLTQISDTSSEMLSAPQSGYVEIALYAKDSDESPYLRRSIKVTNGKFDGSIHSKIKPNKVVLDPMNIWIDRNTIDNEIVF